jgi:YVTN family beta-propeller protein
MQGVHQPPSPGYPWGGTYDAATGEIWFGDSQGSAIYAIDGRTGNETRAVSIPISAYQQNLSGAVSAPQAIAYDPFHNILAVAAVSADSVTLLDATSAAVEHVIRFSAPWSLQYDPSNHLIYVGGGDQNVTVIDGGNGTEVAKILVPGWVNQGLTYDPLVGRILGVAQFSSSSGAQPGSVYAISDATQKVVSNFTNSWIGGATAIDFDPDNGQIYVLDGSWILAYNGTTYAPLSKISSGAVGLLAVNPLTDEIYASSSSTGLAVVYGSNDTLRPQGIRAVGGGLLTGVVYDPVSGLVLAINAQLDSVERINASTDQPVGESSLLGANYLQAVYDPDNGLLYCAAYTAFYTGVSIIDPTTSPSILGGISTGGSPSGLAYDSPDHRLFVTNYWNASVTVIDTVNGTVMNASVPVGRYPYGVAYDPVNGEVYVADGGNGTLSVLNASTLRQAHAPIPVGSAPYGIAVDPAQDLVFVSNLGSGNVTVVNGSSDQVKISGIPVGSNPQGLLYDPQNGFVYVADTGSNELTVIDAATGIVTANFSVGNGPAVLALDPQDDLVFSGNANGNTVTVVDAGTNLRLGSDLPVSQTPEGIAYVPTTRQVDVTNWNAPAINIIANTPYVASFEATPAEVGLPVTLSAVVENGTPPYSFAYSGLPAGCASPNASTLECLPTQIGEYRTVVDVRDSAGYGWSSALTWTVAGHVAVAAASAAPNPVDVGTTTVFQVTVEGGSDPGAVTYSYVGLPTGCVSYNTSNLSCTPTGIGTFVVTVSARDAAGGSSSEAAGLEVVAHPTITTAFASPSSVEVNASAELVVVVGGGVVPYTYAWTGLPSGCSSANLSSFACTPNLSGDYQVEVVATDALGIGVRASFGLSVSTPAVPSGPPLDLASFTAVPETVTLGGSSTFLATVTGGAPPFEYRYAGLPPGCETSSSEAFECRATAVGTFTVGLTVNDSHGQMATGNATLVVTAALGAPPGAVSQGMTPWEWVGVGLTGFAAGVVGAAILAAWVRRVKVPPSHESGP